MAVCRLRPDDPTEARANVGGTMTTTTTQDDVHDEAVACIERILRLWLQDSDLTVFCGVWSNGAIMELLPRGRARLTGQLYTGRFSGLRDLILDDGGHHVHLDLARLSHACYLVAPSVCYGFRPSFELRITTPGADPLRDFGLGLAMRHPYEGETLRDSVAAAYFARAAAHLKAYPQAVSLRFENHPAQTRAQTDWACIDRFLEGVPELQHFRRLIPNRNNA